MSEKIRILLVCMRVSPFIQKDLELLRRHFDVDVVDFDIKRPKYILRSLFSMIKGTLWADLTFSWFANFHAVLAVLLSKIFWKKSIVIAGGYSVANIQEIKYGLIQNPLCNYMVKIILRNTDKVLATSDSNRKEILNCTKREVEIVYHGVDFNEFIPKGKKDNLVITVGYVSNSNLKRKGLETFVKSAKYLPNIDFTLIGKHMDKSIFYLKSITAPNVKFTDFVSNDELLKYYQQAKVYVQLSAHEGFGISLAEAMLCECVPVVTNRGAIPEVVGDIGFHVPYADPKATAEAIKEALKSNKGKEARERIVNNFNIEKREEELMKLISEVVGD